MRFSTLKNALVFVLLALILTLDNYMYQEKTDHSSNAESLNGIKIVKGKMNHLPKWTEISYEPDSMMSAPMDYQLDAMLASQQLKLFCING